MKVAVVDHGMGNLRSVAKALEAAGASVSIEGEPDALDSADAVCVPGQGIFGRCIDNLSHSGLDEKLGDWLRAARPYLGICLGMQILFETSEERGPVAGLGVLGGKVTLLGSSSVGSATAGPDGLNGFSRLRIPHIGWNTVAARGQKDEYFYFDHSYAVRPADDSIVTGWCEHGDAFAAAIRNDATTAVQFHPEKSGAAGIEYLRGWVKSI